MRKTCSPVDRRTAGWVAALGAGLALGGCGQPTVQPLQPEAFLARRQVDGTGRAQPVDQSGPLVVGTVNPVAPGGDAPDARRDAPPGIPRAIEESVKPIAGPGPGARAAAGTPTAPAAPAAPSDPADTTIPGKVDPALAAAEGGYQLVGTVLADVNGTPIYADKFLKVLEKPLEAEAKRHDEPAFRVAATELISKQIREFINAELEYATAQRLLDSRDQAIARGATVQWRVSEVTAAGGSEELARKKWANEGFDFEERAQEEYRTNMRRLYFTRKEHPKIQVRQIDIRKYYEANRDKEFTTQAAARFRVIKVDVARTGGRDAAMKKAQDLLKRAKAGEDFDKLAASVNDEPAFKQPFSDPIAKGAFAVEEVEDAVWQLDNGQLSDLIETKGAGRAAFYIARLEKKEAGRTVPFQEAQDQIVKTLRMQQFAALRAGVQDQLRKDAIIRLHPQMLQVAMDMAMQRYATWKGVAAKAG